MKGIKHIVNIENPKGKVIRLYTEGLFYKAYEYSAYLFVHFIKKYNVRKKYLKNIACEVVSIGFPKATFEKIVDKNIKFVDEGDTRILLLDEEIDEAKYESWKADIALVIDAKPVVKPDISENTEIEAKLVDLIRSFRIENKTPMDCMLFIAELKTICG